VLGENGVEEEDLEKLEMGFHSALFFTFISSVSCARDMCCLKREKRLVQWVQK
jgi:hypothetical protein